MKFLVDLDLVDDATPQELAQAIKDAISTLAMRNGDTIYLENSAIQVTPVEQS